MRPLKVFSAWLDRDWERRSYNPIFAFGQRLIWCIPIVAIGLAGHLVGAKQGDVLYDWGLPIGMVLSMILMIWSAIRWLSGYSRTDWQEKQSSKQRQADRR
jgi:cytochrome c-type biogenesis protein CcmH/NrfF